jgi:hypothetical protein
MVSEGPLRLAGSFAGSVLGGEARGLVRCSPAEHRLRSWVVETFEVWLVVRTDTLDDHTTLGSRDGMPQEG